MYTVCKCVYVQIICVNLFSSTSKARRCVVEEEAPRVGWCEAESTETELQVERAAAGIQQQRQGAGGTQGHSHVQRASGQSGNVDERKSKHSWSGVR